MTTEPRTELKEGSAFAGYVIGRKLGEGAMGEVHQATAPGGEQVALKILRLAAVGPGAELERRFSREAALCSSLRHPHVVSVSDHGVHQGLPFLAMALLRGRDLEDTLAKTGPLRPDVAVGIALQACAGVRAAHEAGVVHRDLKPANIFLDEKSDGEISAIVCDFGVAKVRDEDGSLTASGAVLGTPLYMAPEQLLSSKRVDARCDVWALGMVLYHALAGNPAFASVRSIGDLMLLLNECRVPPLQDAAPWVAPALARIVHAALLPLDKRIASVRGLEEALERWSPGARRLGRADLEPLAEDRRRHVATRAMLPADAAELREQGDDTMLGDEVVVAAPDALIGATIAERYRITAKLGAGGMGAVYEAIDTLRAGEACVAVKIMQQESGSRGTEAARRFLREAKASARIESPHVTRFLDSGLDGATGAPFIVMERLRGKDLAAHLVTTGALAAAPAVALFLQACEALTVAHALGIVHRDIKPSNLFLHEEGDSIVLKVCDFGIAKVLSREGASEASTELTRTGGLLGSPLYMSPEQAKSSKSVDERTDVFSLGLTLHESLSGARPWPGRTSMGEIIVAVCTEDVPRLTDCAPWVDPALSDVVAKALCRDPAERFASIGAFAAALEPFATSRTVARADLAGVPSAERARASARPSAAAASVAGDALMAKAKATADPVSFTSPGVASRGGRARTAAIAAAVIALVVAGGAVAVLRNTSGGAASSSPALASAEASASSLVPKPAPTASSTASASSASPSAPVSVSGAPAASAVRPAAAVAAVAAQTRPSALAASPSASAPRSTRPGASASSTGASAVAPAPAASVGRGFTATDLPGN